MANFGALKVLFQVLSANLVPYGINAAVGEENIIAQEFATPYVCVVPSNGNYDMDTPAYQKDADPDRDAGWQLRQNIDIYLWGWSTEPAATAIDHIDETENIRARVLQALWQQRAAGLYFDPTGERWQLMGDAQNRYGRALVLTVKCDVSVLNVEIDTATVTSVPTTVAITS